MTGRGPVRPSVRVPPARRMAAAGLAIFLVVFTLLAWQVRTGRDPALTRAAARRAAVAAARARATPARKPTRTRTRTVVEERLVVLPGGQVVEQPVIVHVKQRAGGSGEGDDGSAASAAPAPAPAAPAPLVTRSS